MTTRAAIRSADALIRASLACALAAALDTAVVASDLPAAFDTANRFYEQGQFPAAAAAYEALATNGQVSAAVLFNLGNARFQAGQTGRAVAAWRRAAMLAPRDADIAANLALARAKTGVAPPPAAVPGQRWLETLTLNEWTALTGACLGLFFLVLLARELRPPWRPATAGLTLGLGLAAAALVVGLVLRGSAARSEIAVSVVPEAVARYGPLDESQPHFTLPNGAEARVVDRKGDWRQVLDASRRTGWVRDKDLEVIP